MDDPNELVTLRCCTYKQPFQIEARLVRRVVSRRPRKEVRQAKAIAEGRAAPGPPRWKNGAPVGEVGVSRCPDCEAARLAEIKDYKREQRAAARALRKSRKTAGKRLLNSSAFHKFMRTSFYKDRNEALFDRLFDQIEVDVRGQKKFEPFSNHILSPRFIEEMLAQPFHEPTQEEWN